VYCSRFLQEQLFLKDWAARERAKVFGNDVKTAVRAMFPDYDLEARTNRSVDGHDREPRVYFETHLPAFFAALPKYVAVFFSNSDARNEVKLLPPPHTSPRAELAALLLALEKGAVSCDVVSDSSFVCQAFERGWPEDFAHQDLIVQIRAMWPSRDLQKSLVSIQKKAVCN